MDTTNPLIDDLGGPQPTPEDNPLVSDLGGIRAKTDWTGSDSADASTKTTSTTPVTDEAKQAAANVLKQLPRNAMNILGKVADIPGDIWDLAFHPEGAEGAEIGQGVAAKSANALENAAPSLKPVNQGSLERVIGQGIEGAGVGALTGPLEGILPTAVSGAASQTAQEAGFGPVAQTVAGLTPFAPSLASASIRGAVRGRPAGGEAMRGTLADADAAGLKVSVGQASGNPLIKGYEALATKLPGGGPLAETRNMNAQVEHSVSDIQKTIDPHYDESPSTPREAGEEIQEGANKSIARGKKETGVAKDAMDEAVGGKDTPMSADRTHTVLQKITAATGIPEIDEALQTAKTRSVGRVIKSVQEKPPVHTAYSTDGEGAHVATSPNGETHAVETASGDLKVTRSDTKEFDENGNELRGKGEGTYRLQTLAHAATAQGKALVSDISVSPAEAAAYEKLRDKGWTVEKNPNAEVNPATKNTISDSPKNPVYRVTAPKTEVTPGAGAPKQSSETHFGGEWTYDPKTGKSEPTIESPKAGEPADQIKAQLNPETPWTFDSLRALRTQVGRAVRRDPTGQMGRLYGAMTDDLKDFVKSKGPDAEQKFEFFNSVAKTNGDQRKALEKAIKNEGGPGEIFRKAMSGSQDDAGKIARVMGAMNAEGQNTFRSVVLHRMGRVAGAQTGPFSADTFLKNWDKMSQEAKNTIFGASKTTAPLRTSLDALTKSLTDMKAGGMLKSGLGTELQRAGTGVSHGVGLVATLLALKEVGTPLVHMAEGHPFMAAGSAAAMGTALLTNPVMSRVLVNPKLVSWLAQATKAPKGMAPVLMNQLNRMAQKDPDAKGLKDLIQGADLGTQQQATATPKPKETGVRTTIYPKISRSAGMQPLPGGGYGIPPESM